MNRNLVPKMQQGGLVQRAMPVRNALARLNPRFIPRRGGLPQPPPNLLRIDPDRQRAQDRQRAVANLQTQGGLAPTQLVPGLGLTPPPPNLPSLQQLIDMSDDELMQYIPTRNIRAGSKTFQQRQTPEEFRQRLQQQINLKPGDKGFGQDARAFIARPPQGRPAPKDPFRQGIRPTEIFGPDGQIIGPADQIAVGRPVPLPAGEFKGGEDTSLDFGGAVGNLAGRPPVQAGGRDAYNQITPARRPETTVNLPPDVQVQDTPPPPGAPSGINQPQPFASQIDRVETGLDPLTKQLLFGLDGKGGFIPGAMRAAERTFFDAEGRPIVIPEQVAGFSPDQLIAQELTRQAFGIERPFLRDAESAFRGGVSAMEEGLQRAREREEQGLGATQEGLGGLLSGLGQQERLLRGATDQFGRSLGGIGALQLGATGQFGGRLGESEGLLRGTLGGYDPSMTSRFFNPFEEQVVQQTVRDVMEQGALSDIGARAQDIARGGESAFGSRARLGAEERQRALGRGLAEALGGIRARGFSEAQQTGLGEFARQRQAERLASQGLAGLAGQRLGAQQQLGSTLAGLAGQRLGSQQALGQSLGSIGSQRFGGQQALASAFGRLGNLEQQIAQQQQQARFGLGSALQGLGAQAQQQAQAGIGQLAGFGQQQQAQQQAMLDAQRRNLLQAQQAPLAQFQALAPFISMAPAGQFQTRTTFTPPPSPTQAALSTGLGAFGAFGNFLNPQ